MQINNIKKILQFLFCFLCLLPAYSYAQNTLTLRGKIVDDIEPLIAVLITEVDKNNRVVGGTSTNMDGEFVLNAKSKDNKLVISYMGYVKQELKIGDRTVFNVKLESDAALLSEVEVVGQRVTNTGGLNVPTREVSIAMQRVDARDFEGIQVASVEDALQGRVSGLDIVGNSGAPGSGMSMRIRGNTSLNNSSQPLIVVNGIPFETNIASDFDFVSAREEQYADLLNVNPDDILDIVILKDAASTAIWGSKGANGVLQINTKKGAMGKPKLQYSFRLTAAWMPDPIPLLSGDEYTMLMKEAYLNPNLDESKGNIPEYNYVNDGSDFFWNYNNNTDWVSELTRTAWKKDHNISLSGGGERGDYRISMGYLDETGIVIGQQLKRFSTRIDLRYKLSDRLLFSSEFAYTYTDNDKSYDDKILELASKKMPNVPVYARDKYGNYTDTYFNINRATASPGFHDSQKNMVNPVAMARLAQYNDRSYRVIPVFRLQYDILDPDKQMLRFRSNVALDVNDIHTTRFYPKEISGADYTDGDINKSFSGDQESTNIQLDNNLTWRPILPEKHSLLLYASVQTTIGRGLSQKLESKWGASSGMQTIPSGYPSVTESGESENRSYGILGTMHYAFLGRYIMDFTLRRDVSSRFGPSKRVGYFPGVSLKWIISDEPFMKNLKFINLLAVRPSWGLSGNQPDKDNLYRSRYNYYDNNYMDMKAIHSGGLQIPNLQWEKTRQTNIGLDLSLFDGKLITDLNYYFKRTSNMLQKDLSMPSTSGYAKLEYENVGVMDNNGWELNLHAPSIIKAGNFSVDVSLNFANYSNTIQELSDKINPQKGDMAKNGEYLRSIVEGNPLGSFYGYRYKGVYAYNNYVEGSQESAPVARDANGNVLLDKDGVPKPMYFMYNSQSSRYQFRGGDAIYEDVNNDGSIDELDVVYLGSANPKLTGGFGINIRYKNFSVNSFFHFRYGNKIVNEARMQQEAMYYNDNQSVAVRWRWRAEGDGADGTPVLPRALHETGYNWLGSDRFVEDGSFLRFKYLTFNYSVPKNLLKKFFITDLKFYCTINNLHVWTNYSGVDPEVGYAADKNDPFKIGYDNSKTPRSKDATFGVTIGF